MRTGGRRILAAALATVTLLMLFAAPAEAAERYCFQRKSIKILKDITGLLKKENLKETRSRQKKIAADLEKIRKGSAHQDFDPDFGRSFLVRNDAAGNFLSVD